MRAACVTRMLLWRERGDRPSPRQGAARIRIDYGGPSELTLFLEARIVSIESHKGISFN